MTEEKKLISEGEGYAPPNPRSTVRVPYPTPRVKPKPVTVNKPKPTRRSKPK